LFAPVRRRCIGRSTNNRDSSEVEIVLTELRGRDTLQVWDHCMKLFNVVRPDRAYFGQKDAAQRRDTADGST
jgi:pantothenate synthetase